MPRLVQTLPDGPLDIIGDVHGEIDALRRLLGRLGCDPDAATAQRPLVFVGDLVDRGPDSPAVVRLVKRLVEAGIASSVAGNHELNLLQGDHKEGNGWFFGHNDGYHLEGSLRPFSSVEVADDAERAELRAFLASLPLALERPDLRVVHACWDERAFSELPEYGDVGDLADKAEQRVLDDLQGSGVLAVAEREKERFAGLRERSIQPDRALPAVQQVSLAEQRLNPFRVLTSGREHPIDIEETFFVGGKWRVVERTRWWDDYTDEPAVIIGHYWRRRDADVPGKRDLWDDVDGLGWAGPLRNVFCVDYSVGRRFLERWHHPGRGAEGPRSFHGALGALRWPERTVVFDDREGEVPTAGFGG